MLISLPSSVESYTSQLEIPRFWDYSRFYNALNLSAKVAGSDFCAWLSSLTSMAMVVRALGGSIARKLRAVLPDLGLKGEKAVVTEVRYLVSIVGGIVGFLGLLVYWFNDQWRSLDVARGGVGCGDGDEGWLVAEWGSSRLMKASPFT
jgi:hypothetical protein